MNLNEARNIGREFGLLAHHQYYQLPIEELLRILPHGGGCGPGNLGDKLVPDKILGLNMKPACGPHDHYYHLIALAKKEGNYKKAEMLKKKADEQFLINMVIIIMKVSKWLVIPRLHIAGIYFVSVAAGGGGFIK